MIGIQVSRSASTCAGGAVSRLLSGILSLVPRFGLPITGSISDPRAGASLILGLEHLCSQYLAGTQMPITQCWAAVGSTFSFPPAGLLSHSDLLLIRGSLEWMQENFSPGICKSWLLHQN